MNNNKEDKEWLYGKMRNSGVNISYEDFEKTLGNEEDRKWYYDKAHKMGLQVGSYDDFSRMFSQYSSGKPESVAQQVIDEYDASMGNMGVQAQQTQHNVQPQQVQRKPMPDDGSQFNAALQVPDWTTQEQKAIENIATSGTATPATDKAGQPVYPVKPQEVAYDESVQELRENMPQPLNVHLKNLQDEISSIKKEKLDMLDREVSAKDIVGSFFGVGEHEKNVREARKDAGVIKAAERLLEESQEIVDEAGKAGKTNFVSGLLRGVRDNAFDPEQWTFGLADMADSAYLLRAVQKAEKGEELTPAEEKLLDASVMNMAVNAYYGDMLGRGYKAGQVTAQSLPFMLEFAVNPVSSSGSAIAKNLLKYGMKKFGGKAVNRAVPRIAARLAGDTAAAAAMTGTTGAARVAADAMDRLAGNYEYGRDEDGQMRVEKTGDMSVGEAAARGFGSTLLENQSEMIFNAFKAGGKLAREAAGRSVSMFGGLADNELVKAMKRLRNAPIAKEFRQRTQIGGVFEEYGEEVYNNLASVATGDMSAEDALSVDTNIDTFLGLVPTQLAFSAIGQGGLVRENASARKRLRDFTGRLSEDERELFDELHEAIRGGGTDIPRDFIKATLADDRLSDEQKKERVFAVKDMLTEKKSEDLQTEAEAQEQEEPAMSSEEIQAGKVDTYRRWVRAQRRVSSFGIPQESLDGMTLTQLADNYDLDDKQVQAVAEYKDAQQQFGQYEADFNARLEAERQRAEQQARADVDRLGNKDTGMVTQASYKFSEKPVYVTGGTLAFAEDGTLDRGNSSDTVYYLGEDGKTHMAPASEFDGIVSSTPAENVVTQQAYDAETAFKQAEQASLQSPDIPAPEKGVTFNLNGANYVIERPTPDGGLLAYKLDEAGEIDMANGNVIELSAEEYYNAKEAELWGTTLESVDNVLEVNPENANAPSGGDSNVSAQEPEQTERSSEIVSGRSPQEDMPKSAQGDANVVLSSGQQLADLVATLPKKKTGELDYRSMTPQQQYDYTRLTESPEVAAEDLKADVEAKRAEVEKMKQQLAKATGGQRAELRDKVRGADKELAELEDFFRSVAPAREQAETPDTQPADLSGDEEYMDWVAENSEDPAETAAAYRSAKEAASHENNLRPWQQQLLGMKINTSSFNRFGDRNQVTGALAKGWLRKDGRQLDTLAQELSLLGEEVTEQDIVDFMLQNPSNHVSQRSEIMRKLAARFSEIASAEMGFPVGGPDSNTGRLYLILKEANQKLADLDERQKQEVRQAISDDMLNNDRHAQAVEEFITEDYVAAYDEAMRQMSEEEADSSVIAQMEQQPIDDGLPTPEEMDEIYASLEYKSYGTERQGENSQQVPSEEVQGIYSTGETSNDNSDLSETDREDGEAYSGTEQPETGTEALTSEGNYVPLQRNQTEEDNERTEVESLSGESGGLDGENEAENLLRETGHRTAAQDRQGNGTRESLLGELAERASRSPQWINDLSTLTSRPIAKGGENEAYLSHDGKSVIKVNDFSYLPDGSENFDSFLNRIEAHNELFPQDRINILGFTNNSEGKISVVLSQPYIGNSRPATQEEIDSFLEDMDFYTDMSGNWTDGTYEIADTKPNNVLVDEDGNLHFIDVLPYDTRKPGKMLEIPRKRDAFTPPPIGHGEGMLDYALRVAKAKETDDMRRSVNTNPTDAQKEAGNYKKGHVKLDGYNITIENPKGSTRSGRDAQGNEWSVTMQNDYGYIRGTKAVDGDHIDVFLSDTPEQGNVYVIDQIDQQTGEFDESKVMYGFNSMEEARDAYLSNYSPGWKVGPITEVSKDEFKKWIESSTEKRKAFSEYKSVKNNVTDPQQLPKNLKDAYESEDKASITNAETLLREYVDSQNNLKQISTTYFRSMDNLRKEKDKSSPSYRMNDFIAKTCKDALKKAGIAPETLMGEKKRMEFANAAKDANVLDVMSVDPSFEVLKAVVRNPNTSNNTLQNIADNTNYSYLSDEARQMLDERKGEDDGIRFRFIGEQGASRLDAAEEATIRLDNLSVAREMESAGMYEDEIKKATGWERGADGKWRYETEDIDVVPDVVEKLSIENKEYKLSEVLTDESYSELIKTYPSLEGMKVSSIDFGDDFGGAQFSFDDNMIEFNINAVNRVSYNEVRKTIAHEIQHAIQHIEGFEPGNDPGYILSKDLENNYNIDTAAYHTLDVARFIRKKAERMIKRGEYKYMRWAVRKAMGSLLNSSDLYYMYGPIETLATYHNYKELDEARIKAFERDSRITHVKSEQEAIQGYWNSAGEVEARNVESRIDMNSEQRKRIPAYMTEDVARGDQLFLEKALKNQNSYSSSIENIDAINRRFNKELSGLTEENADKVILDLGNPSDVLLSAGVSDKPMKLYGNKVIKKMKKHGFKPDDLRNLPQAVASPIAVFDNYGKEGNRSILTEMKIDNKNVLVSITIGKGNDVDFNIVSSVFGKGKDNIVDWINKGYATYIDKQKTLDYLHFSGSSIPEASNNREDGSSDYLHHSALKAVTSDNQELSDATKIVENFENPKLVDNNFREGQGIQTDESVSLANDPASGIEGAARRSKKQQAEFAERERRRMVGRARSLTEQLGLDNVEIVTDVSTLEGRKARAKGFFDPKTGKMTIVIPNHTNSFDVEQTLLHESVAHYGLRRLFGRHFDTFLDNVYNNASQEVKERIDSLVEKYNGDVRTATEEYLASLAENTDFENAVRSGWFDKIKQFFLRMLAEAGIELPSLTDNELRYILWRSYENLAHPRHYRNVFETATDVAMQYELKVGNYAEPATVGSVAASESVQGLKAERIEKLRNSKPVEITGEEYKGKYELNRDSAKQWIKDNLRGEYTNKDTGEKIEIRKDGAQKVTSHSMGSEAHLKSLVAIPQMIENSVFIEDRPNEKDNYKYDRYRYYVCGLKIGDVDYTAKITVGVKGASKYYDHSLTKIEKGTLIDNIDALSTTFDNNQNALVSGIKDTKLLSILQENGEKDAGILYRENGEVDTDGTIQAYEDALQTWKFKAREAYQDSMLALKELQNVVERNSGEKLKSFENAYMAENQMSSKSTREAEVYGNKFFKPMLKAVSDLMDNGLTYDVVKRYVMAKHGLERNEVFARRDAVQTSEEEYRPLYKEAEKKYKEGELSEDQYKERLSELDQLRQAKEDAEYNKNRERDYSGLSSLMQGEEDYETAASEFVDEFEKDNDVTELWNAINDATGQTLTKSYESGMMSKKTYDRIKSQFKYYVPLRGWNEETAEDVYEYLASETSPVNSVLKTAKGRTSIADDPFAVIGNMAESTILQGNRNLMKQNFLNMAINHPSELLTVGNVWYVQDLSTGEWAISMPDIREGDRPEEVSAKMDEHKKRMNELSKEGMAQKKRGTLNINYRIGKRQANEHAVIVKQNGEDYVIYVNGNPRAAQAVNGMTNPDVEGNKVFESISRFNRWMAANFTTRNPAFVLSNLSRDLIFSMSAVAVKEDSAYAKAFAKNIPSTMKSIARGLKGKGAKTETDRYFQEFLDNGGETGYTALHNVDEYKRMIGKELNRKNGKTVKAVRAAGEWFSNMNRWAEDVARFNAYRTSRQMGRTIAESVNDAKEITVNFNKKGAGYKTGGLFGLTAGVSRNLYLFFNAAVQSLNNFSKLSRKNRVGFLTLLGGFTSAGFLVPLLNEILMSSDGDDEDYYTNLPEWTRRNNLCLYIGGGRFLTIPLPIELRAFYGLGEMAYQATVGKDKYASENVAYAAINQITELLPINPLGNNGDLVTTFMPDAIKPFWSIHTNKDFTGKPIYRKNAFNEKMPEHTKAYKSTADWLVGLSEWTNELAGGNKYRRAKYLEPVANWNPAKVEYLFESYFGGMATTVNQTGKTLAGLVKTSIDGNFTENVQTRSVPVLNRFLNNASDDRSRFANINNLYYSYYDLYEDVAKDYRGYNNEVARGNFEYLEELKNLIESDEFKVYQIFKSGKAQIDKINKAEKSLPEASEKERKELEKMAADLKQNVVDRIQDELNKR